MGSWGSQEEDKPKEKDKKKDKKEKKEKRQIKFNLGSEEEEEPNDPKQEKQNHPKSAREGNQANQGGRQTKMSDHKRKDPSQQLIANENSLSSVSPYKGKSTKSLNVNEEIAQIAAKARISIEQQIKDPKRSRSQLQYQEPVSKQSIEKEPKISSRTFKSGTNSEENQFLNVGPAQKITKEDTFPSKNQLQPNQQSLKERQFLKDYSDHRIGTNPRIGTDPKMPSSNQSNQTNPKIPSSNQIIDTNSKIGSSHPSNQIIDSNPKIAPKQSNPKIPSKQNVESNPKIASKSNLGVDFRSQLDSKPVIPNLGLPTEGHKQLVVVLRSLEWNKKMKRVIRRSSDHDATLKWTFVPRQKQGSYWIFTLSQSDNYASYFQITDDAVLITGNPKLWEVVCPFELYTKRMRIGNFYCESKFTNQIDDCYPILAPSLKSLKGRHDKSLFRKWAEFPPLNLRQDPKESELRPKAGDDMVNYEQINRYFTHGKEFYAGILIKESYNAFTSWKLESKALAQSQKAIEMTDTLRKELLSREKMYIDAMFKKINDK